jgi:hypothetical protein
MDPRSRIRSGNRITEHAGHRCIALTSIAGNASAWSACVTLCSFDRARQTLDDSKSRETIYAGWNGYCRDCDTPTNASLWGRPACGRDREAVAVASQEKLTPGYHARHATTALTAPRSSSRCLVVAGWATTALEPRLTTALGARAGVRIRQHHQQPRLAQVRVRRNGPLAEGEPDGAAGRPDELRRRLEFASTRTADRSPGSRSRGTRPRRRDPESEKSTLAHVLVASGARSARDPAVVRPHTRGPMRDVAGVENGRPW